MVKCRCRKRSNELIHGDDDDDDDNDDDFYAAMPKYVGPVVGVATGYKLDVLRIEFRRR